MIKGWIARDMHQMETPYQVSIATVTLGQGMIDGDSVSIT